ncbi:unnamed protein product [Owenia fusiformis]|uniref:Uncharacterized protein n=1 Tax=Owenia fusiformis TaxID=6347 RepID=A0A8J1TPX2_OWEFU|nr:unnamed protein product [Owenia fusiformis]
MASDKSIVHLIAGGIGGTAGAVLTCPLEVVKTRLQSSGSTLRFIPQCSPYMQTCVRTFGTSAIPLNGNERGSISLLRCMKIILHKEGYRGLFKGLGPNLVGVAPSRAIYFVTYAQSKLYLNKVLTPDTPLVHMTAAGAAGFSACTCTNPIWLIKTRLQLDQSHNSFMTIRQCISDVYKNHGLKGFYKGITASYFGISETMIHFVIYEALKAKLMESDRKKYANNTDCSEAETKIRHFLKYMLAGATSKTCASTLTYPHEVARTRLREEGNKYRSFVQTLRTVYIEEGYMGLYRGLGTQMVRQIPNTAIMMATYEAVIYFFGRVGHAD